ncbi:FecR family protein [Methylopila sp. Yamaguchi]|uniref:FecR family protein n=1 Tax=Methylopila sp. Yamaguchi TaxID=1437817 RepID=UPI000CCAC231|nr:FecR domain-containing protein [Methylopila sp. Yamaguchi]GBD47831.1 iron siderophore sensor protein FecR [Methylopila sp. Yamaguchi]
MADQGGQDDAVERAAREATTWFVRLNNPLATDADRRAFRAWLDADPLHGAAFAEADELWQDLAAPAQRLRADAGRRVASRRRVGRLAAAAAVAAMLTAGALWRDAGLIDRAFADYAAPPGQRRDISLADGTTVTLDGDSALDVAFAPSAREVTVVRGRAWFEVARDPDRPFTAHADAIAARAVGTAFAVDGMAQAVIVDHGVVEVSGAGRTVTLGPAREVALGADGALGAPQDVSLETALAWKRGLIVLDAAPLGAVADELARRAPGRVVIPDPSLRALRLSGVFRTDDPDAVLEAMRTALGLKTLAIPGLAVIVYR